MGRDTDFHKENRQGGKRERFNSTALSAKKTEIGNYSKAKNADAITRFDAPLVGSWTTLRKELMDKGGGEGEGP